MKNQETRRLFLKSVAAASVAFYVQPSLMGISPLNLLNEFYQEDFYRFKLGKFDCICINDGGLNYPPAQFFKNVEKEQLDAVLHYLHLEHPDWVSIYDILPEEAEKSKIKIFDLVSERNALVIGQHFTPFPSLGHVRKIETGWEWISSI